MPNNVGVLVPIVEMYLHGLLNDFLLYDFVSVLLATYNKGVFGKCTQNFVNQKKSSQ